MRADLSFYVATALSRVADHAKVTAILGRLGHRLSYDWTAHGSVRAEGESRLGEVAYLEAEGVYAADFVVVLLPGGRGTHAELGIALGLGKPVFLHASEAGAAHFFAADGRPVSFYFHPLIVERVVGPFEALAVAVAAWERSR